MERRDELIPGQSEVSAISDINVTPFIDVMLVLLIIFMVTAPLMMGGVKINLPRVDGNPMPRPDHPLIVSLDAENVAYVDKEPVDASSRKEVFHQLAVESESGEVFVRGDGEVKYARMIDLMSELGQAGFARVTLVTNVQTGPSPQLTPPAGAPAPTPGPAPDLRPSTAQAAAPAPAPSAPLASDAPPNAPAPPSGPAPAPAAGSPGA
jgi:biopolymer transport protein TolR